MRRLVDRDVLFLTTEHRVAAAQRRIDEIEAIYNDDHPRATAVLALGLLEGIVDDAFDRYSIGDLKSLVGTTLTKESKPLAWPSWTVGQLAGKQKIDKEEFSAAERVEYLLHLGQLPALITRKEFRELWQYRNQIHFLREVGSDSFCTLGIALAALSALSLSIEHRRNFRYFDNRDWRRVAGFMVHTDNGKRTALLESVDPRAPAVVVTDKYRLPIQLTFDVTIPEKSLFGIVFNFESFQEHFDCLRVDTRVPGAGEIADQGLMVVRGRWMWRDFTRRLWNKDRLPAGTYRGIVLLTEKSLSLKLGDREFLLEGGNEWAVRPSSRLGLLAEIGKVTVSNFETKEL